MSAKEMFEELGYHLEKTINDDRFIWNTEKDDLLNILNKGSEDNERN